MRDGRIDRDSRAGTSLGFTATHFDDGSYLWKKGEDVYISFVFSKKKGSFSRLVRRIQRKKYTVVVPTPLASMKAILSRWQAKRRIEVTERGDTVECWVIPKLAPKVLE